jgi:hypothetical protein
MSLIADSGWISALTLALAANVDQGIEAFGPQCDPDPNTRRGRNTAFAFTVHPPQVVVVFEI